MPARVQQTAPQPAVRILRMSGMRFTTGLGQTAIYERLNPSSKYFDPEFPKPISLGGGERCRAIGWVENEVQTWLRKQIERRAQRSHPPGPALSNRRGCPGSS